MSNLFYHKINNTVRHKLVDVLQDCCLSCIESKLSSLSFSALSFKMPFHKIYKATVAIYISVAPGGYGFVIPRVAQVVNYIIIV